MAAAPRRRLRGEDGWRTVGWRPPSEKNEQSVGARHWNATGKLELATAPPRLPEARGLIDALKITALCKAGSQRPHPATYHRGAVLTFVTSTLLCSFCRRRRCLSSAVRGAQKKRPGKSAHIF
ncbi:hypothetical protein MRX96_056124 [Rhipicephalus microplus]